MFANNAWLLSLIASLACLALVVLNRSSTERTRMILGGIAVAAGMVTIAIIAE